MKKVTIVLMVLTILTKILGFVRDVTLSYFYGASSISDAYLVSLTIPTMIFDLIGTGIATSYIPIFNSIVKDKNEQLGNRFTSNVINITMIFCTLIVLIVITFTTPIIKILAIGFEGETLTIAISFTRISIFGIYFASMTYIFRGYLNLKNNFIAPALMGVPLNFFMMISIALSCKFDIVILSIGTVIAMASQTLFLKSFIYKQGFHYSFVLDRQDEYLKKMIYLSLPVIIGISVNQINVIVDRTIASQVVIGGLSALTYANRLNLFIQAIFVASIATVMYPMISRMAVNGDIDGLKKSVTESINGINLLILPTSVGAMIFAEPIVKLLFGRGAFSSEAISMTSSALFFFSIGMVGVGLREVLSRALYSLQDTKTPMMNAGIAMVMNIILNIVLSKFLGIGGLALATSISAIFCTILLFISLRKKIGSFGMKNIFISFVKILVAAIIMGAIAKLSYNVLFNNISANMSLIISVGTGALVYIVIIYSMKIQEFDVLVLQLKKKIKG